MGNTKLFRFARTGLNLPQVILDQVASYETEMDNSAQFAEQGYSLEPETKCAASKLDCAYHHFCQALGHKPQSNNALEKLTGVYQSRTSSEMHWTVSSLLCISKPKIVKLVQSV